jgi:hypothetical protein
MSPARSHDRGEPRNGTSRKTWEDSGWSSKHYQGDNDEDQTGFSSLRLLFDAFDEKLAVIHQLQTDFELTIWWSGRSDSTQGGFVLPADLVQRLAQYRCDFFGTAFLAEEDDAV